MGPPRSLYLFATPNKWNSSWPFVTLHATLLSCQGQEWSNNEYVSSDRKRCKYFQENISLDFLVRWIAVIKALCYFTLLSGDPDS